MASSLMATVASVAAAAACEGEDEGGGGGFEGEGRAAAVRARRSPGHRAGSPFLSLIVDEHQQDLLRTRTASSSPPAMSPASPGAAPATSMSARTAPRPARSARSSTSATRVHVHWLYQKRGGVVDFQIQLLTRSMYLISVMSVLMAIFFWSAPQIILFCTFTESTRCCSAAEQLEVVFTAIDGFRGDDDVDTCTTWHWHSSSVKFLKFSSDGAYLFSGGLEGVIVLWQLDTGKRRNLD